MQYLGIDWGTRKAAWCATWRARRRDGRGHDHSRRGWALDQLVHTLGPDVRGCVEMMSGAVWVRDQPRSRAAGRCRSPTPRKVEGDSRRWRARQTASTRACSPSSCRRDLVPALWVPSL